MQAAADLPEEFRSKLENIDIVIEDRPSQQVAARAGLVPGQELLGLYEGVPRTMRTSRYSLVPPDKITLFQRAIERSAGSESRVAAVVQSTLRHEIAHHFGIGDRRLEEIAREGRKGRKGPSGSADT